MQRITINLMNMYDADPTILDHLVLPTQIERGDFIGRLMIDIGESEVCITNPHIMKIAIGAWSRGKLPVWQKLTNVLDFEYNPIWNVDGETTHSGNVSGNRTYGRSRTEKENENTDRDRTLQGDETAGRERTEQETTETSDSRNTTVNGTGTTETESSETTSGLISADNVETWSNDTKTETGKTGTEDSTKTETTVETGSGETERSTTENISDTVEKTETESTTESRIRTADESIKDTEANTGTDAWTEKRTGNIGVTTTQKMMTEEVEFWQKYDIIGYIINQFAAEFCLLVY